MEEIEPDREFYMTLPSNVQPDIHPANTASAWRTTFEESYDLYGGNWEVALSEITYVNTMPTLVNESFKLAKIERAADSALLSYVILIPEGDIKRICPHDGPSKIHMNAVYDEKTQRVGLQNHFYKTSPLTFYMKKDFLQQLGFISPRKTINPNDMRQIWKSGQQWLWATFPPNLKPGVDQVEFTWYTRYEEDCLDVTPSPGYYPTGEALAKELNQPTSDLKVNFTKEGQREVVGSPCQYQFAFLPQRNRFALSLGKGTNIIFNNGLHERLGFEREVYKSEEDGNYLVARYMPQLNRGIYNIYLYCSLCEPVRVGNVLAPLLRTVEVNNQYRWGETRCIRFAKPIYVPVKMSCFNSVEIHLFDDSGQPIHFEEGRTTPVLHFRRHRSSSRTV